MGGGDPRGIATQNAMSRPQSSRVKFAFADLPSDEARAAPIRISPQFRDSRSFDPRGIMERTVVIGAQGLGVGYVLVQP